MSRTTDADSAKSIVALVGAIVAILIWTLIGFPNTLKGVSGPNDLAALYGNMTGVGFAHALIVGLIAYFAFIRRWAPRRAAIYFLILVLVSVGANLALFSIVRHAARNNAQRDGVQAQIATREIGDALHAALKANAGGGPIDTTPKAQGDSGEMERIMKQWLAQLVTDGQNYKAELTALGYPSLMSAARLASPGGTRNAHAKLVQAKAIVRKYRALNGTRLADLQAAINASHLNETEKSSALASLSQGVEAGSANTQRLWDLQEAMLGEEDAAITVLIRSPGSWQVVGGKLRFTQLSAMAAYNTHIEQSKALAHEATALQATIREKSDRDLAALKNTVDRAAAAAGQ